MIGSKLGPNASYVLFLFTSQMQQVIEFIGRSGGTSNPQPPVLETGALAIELHS